MENIRVVGLRGTYEFKDSLNSNGFTPLDIFQVLTQPDSLTIKQHNVAIYDSSKSIGKRLQMSNSGSIHWNTPDGKPPFDRIQIKKIEISLFRLEVLIVWIVITAGLCIAMLVLIMVKPQLRTFGNILLSFGAITCNCHIFLLPLRNVEPVAFHCSLFGALILAGVSTGFVAMWEMIDFQLKEIQHAIASITGRQIFGKKFCRTKLEIVLFAVVEVGVLLCALLFVLSSPVESDKERVTTDITFGRREIEMSTRRTCHLVTNTFPSVVIAITLSIVLTIIIKTILDIFNIRIYKKKLEELQKKRMNNTLKIAKHINFGPFFSVKLTIIIATLLVLLLIEQYAFYATAFASNAIAVIVLFLLIKSIKLVNSQIEPRVAMTTFRMLSTSTRPKTVIANRRSLEVIKLQTLNRVH